MNLHQRNKPSLKVRKLYLPHINGSMKASKGTGSFRGCSAPSLWLWSIELIVPLIGLTCENILYVYMNWMLLITVFILWFVHNCENSVFSPYVLVSSLWLHCLPILFFKKQFCWTITDTQETAHIWYMQLDKFGHMCTSMKSSSRSRW